MDSKRYRGRFNREKIISKWEEKYKSTHPFLMIHITPSANIGLVRENGTNMGKREVKATSKIDNRPLATYDNKRSLYGIDNLP